MTSDVLQAFLQMNWGWTAGLAVSLAGLTLAAGNLRHPGHRDPLALWLMGAQSDKGWSDSFPKLFDAPFGRNHPSIHCFGRCTAASLGAVALIWLLLRNLGALFEHGAGTNQDFARAARLFEVGCDGGDPAGCANLGYLVMEGRGTDTDLDRAAAPYARACEGKVGIACTRLGVLRLQGAGGTPDPAEAARLFGMACASSDLTGCSNLGAMLTDGLGVPRDVEEAARLLHMACDGGEPQGCANLGVLTLQEGW